jgi:pimeloyl-ACP methyl ester carboxylesterase
MHSDQSPSSKVPIVVINGLGAPRLAAQAYGMYFRAHGLDVSTIPQPLLLFEDIRTSARKLGAQVERTLARTGADKVNLLGMSLGGLIGLYYVKCLAGRDRVNRLVSIGGPLGGVPMLDRLGRVLPIGLLGNVGQTGVDSELQKELRAATVPDGVRIYSVGSNGDPLTPRPCWAIDGVTPIETNHGVFPVGHWMLFTHPKNLRAVYELVVGEAP